MKLTIGIDPGFTGALAVYNPMRNTVEVFDFPLHEINGKRHLDMPTLAQIVDGLASMVGSAAIEQPNPMPGQGISSTGRFLKCCGQLEGLLYANFIPFIGVRPAVWKKFFSLGADKDQARRLASTTWPKQAGLFARKKDDGRAEAALLALYGHKRRLA